MVVARLPLGYPLVVRQLALVLAIVGCRHAGSPQNAGSTDEVTVHTSLVIDDFKPTYDKAELDTALAAERAAVAAAEQHLDELDESIDPDQLRIATQDVAVRQRFLAQLEVCAADGRVCPPR